MTSDLQPAFRPETSILALGGEFYDAVRPADFPQATLRFRNQRWAARVGLGALSDEDWVRHFARFEALPGSLPQPLALRYHGHQFRVYNPDIGDGRGFLFAQLRDDGGRLLDLGTKGSGQTPYSRFGDGRLTLKGGVREILATEMLEALGVDTSKTFSLIETGEALDRGDEPSPTRSAVLVRLSHGHIRIGSFQRLAYFKDEAGLRTLTDYVLRHYFDDASGDPLRLLDHVVARTARLAGQLMAAGFVHGVLNSDNINVTGESFDYGPWRFAPGWDPGFTAAYFDHQGLYAFGRQPEAIHWDAMQLAVSLRAVAADEPMIAILDQFAPRYRAAVAAALLWRLGVKPGGDDQALAAAIEHGLTESQAPVADFFHASFGGTIADSFGPAFAEARQRLQSYAPRKARGLYWQGAPCAMLIDEVEAIWAAIDQRDDWQPLHAKIDQIRAMGTALAD
ncbi:protein adenylyltransferase SelO family protein [Sphingomonas sp.]|uniref:protein adenylyltransferase SelO family protein n=1 Tax=Sphingomonas sp. TaxID=28214 RepID=UPI001D4D43B1|nr:YdiU family protein [Sphingomonas sp.]MBX9796181.1 YdiU family protein [Sphingomonas sp.]